MNQYTMEVFAEAHRADLLAEADERRRDRMERRDPQPRRSWVAGLVAAIDRRLGRAPQRVETPC
jgi:hypothetical protein